MKKIQKNQIQCTVCGRVVGTTPTRKLKLEADGLLDTYKCRDCKLGKLQKSTVKKATKKKVVTKKHAKAKKSPKSKVICSACGEAKGTTKTRLEKLISQFGSREQLDKNYVCIKCRREKNLTKNGIKKVTKRKKLKKKILPKTKDGTYTLPAWMACGEFGSERSMSFKELIEATENVCWRPDLYRDSKCRGCIYWKGCLQWNKYNEKGKRLKYKKAAKKKK